MLFGDTETIFLIFALHDASSLLDDIDGRVIVFVFLGVNVLLGFGAGSHAQALRHTSLFYYYKSL